MHWTTKLASVGIWVAAAAGLSCAGPDESPIWSVTKTQYDPYGNAALLTPANDSRVNLLLLLAARQGQPGPADLGARTFFSWNDLTAAIVPTAGEPEFVDPSRCQSMAGGKRDFLAALESSKASRGERVALADARKAVAAACTDLDRIDLAAANISSRAGKGFLRYLEGASAFYRGEFAVAESAFADLAAAPDPWLREVGAYMAARTALNVATTAALDEYGTLAEPDKRDPALAARATAALDAYLKAYPKGRYASSARGLIRRAHWVANDDTALAADYAAALAGPGVSVPADALRLAEEIDYKLPTASANAAGPLLLAIADLQRMRTAGEWAEPCCQPLSEAELGAQAKAFEGHGDLYGYLRAAHAFYVAGQPERAISLIPDDARRSSYDALSFSRQMLRGMALDAAKDVNARGFWLELIGGATAPGQRRAVELALARHDEVTGGLARVFAADSKVTDPIAREILLQHGAGPALLRQQAKAGANEHERTTALYILLAKGLTRGFYADFLRDLALVPAGAPFAGGIPPANAFSAPADLLAAQVSAGDFVAGPTGDPGCPALRETVVVLERNPLQPGARLCLGEFMRLNRFDWTPFDAPLDEGLGSSRSRFPGTPLVRQTIYTDIIADPKAGASSRAFALFRVVHCYAPSGNNSCGGEDVAIGQRKAWFQQLKREYPQSRWAQELKYYW